MPRPYLQTNDQNLSAYYEVGAWATQLKHLKFSFLMILELVNGNLKKNRL